MNTRTCPYCGNEIAATAQKCRYCGEWLNGKPAESPNRNNRQTVIINQRGGGSNGVGTAGFVLALISLFFCWLPGIGWFAWFLGLILSFIGMFKSPRGLAVAGFIISIIDLLILIAIGAAIDAVIGGILSRF